MSWHDTIECGGAPRDMGLAQGSAVAVEVRRHLERAGLARRGRKIAGLRAFASGGALGGGMGREIVRHYPHLAERMTGIARGAGVSFEGLMEDFIQAEGAPGPNPPLAVPAAAAAGPSRSGKADCSVLRSFDLAGDLPWMARRSAPEHGFRSVELTLPWLASSLAGVNESGLAVALVPAPPSAALFGRSLEPACQLLVQECLQRFERTEAAVEWCLKRPSFGCAGIVFADRSGEIALVEVEGETRRAGALCDGFALAGLDQEGQTALRKRCEETGALDPAALAVVSDEEGAVVWLDCAGAELRLRAPGRATLSLTPPLTTS